MDQIVVKSSRAEMDKVDIIGCKATLKQANNLLIFRHFTECLEVCCVGVASIKNYAEDESIKEIMNALVAVAIQAFAELNRWLEVLPFVSQTYNGLEDCPPLIVKLCLLLHVKLQDHVTCTVIANIWLKNSNNFSLTDYQTIVELYVERVLIASRRWSDVRIFLDSCPGLNASSKDKYLRKINGFHRQYLESSADEIQVIEKSSENNSTSCRASSSSHVRLTDADEKSTTDSLPDYLKCALNCIKDWLQKYHLPIYIVRSFCLVFVFVYLLSTKWITVFTSINRSTSLKKLVSLLTMLWRGMFAPIYTVSR